MSQTALAWHWAKGVTSPIIGAAKLSYFDDAVGAVAVLSHVCADREFYRIRRYKT